MVLRELHIPCYRRHKRLFIFFLTFDNSVLAQNVEYTLQITNKQNKMKKIIVVAAVVGALFTTTLANAQTGKTAQKPVVKKENAKAEKGAMAVDKKTKTSATKDGAKADGGTKKATTTKEVKTTGKK